MSELRRKPTRHPFFFQLVACCEGEAGLAGTAFSGLQAELYRLILRERPPQHLIEQAPSMPMEWHELAVRQQHEAVGHLEAKRIRPRTLRKADQRRRRFDDGSFVSSTT